MRSKLKWIAGALGLMALMGLLLLWSASIDPLAYRAPVPPGLAGALAPNRALLAGERLAEDKILGPEDVAVDSAGWMYAGTEDGRIVRCRRDAAGEEIVETFAITGGRPLGLHWDGAGRLIVADADKGLLRVDREGHVEILTREAAGLPFAFTDDLDIAADGKIYFSDASWRFGARRYLFDLLEARPNGRLLVYDPAEDSTRVLLQDLYFANGVALSRDESFVLVNETYRYRIRRYWLRGPKAGTSDIFIDNLPGFPDGTSANRRGTFWVALYTVRNPLLDDVLHPRPLLKRVLSRLPRALWPKPEPYGLVLALDETGSIIASLHDPAGERFEQITSVEEVGGHLYLGTLHRPWLGRVPLPADLIPEPTTSD